VALSEQKDALLYLASAEVSSGSRLARGSPRCVRADRWPAQSLARAHPSLRVSWRLGGEAAAEEFSTPIELVGSNISKIEKQNTTRWSGCRQWHGADQKGESESSRGVGERQT
jgi:hypothetical protein